jgi:hypothetical protein
MAVKHLNNGNCQKCEEIFNRYPGFNIELKEWFKAIQAVNKDAHISQAGRGKEEQELYFKKGSSKAKYGQSSHNYNAAIDLFQLTITGAEWKKPWFEKVVEPAIVASNGKFKWYGLKGSPFFELPHVEVSNWKELLKDGKIKLVE